MGSIGESMRVAKEPNIHLYAEHLLNIRTLSIQASLATQSNNETKATLSTDGSKLMLTHGGETASIELPIRIPEGHNDATLAIPAAPSNELSFRLKVQENPGSGLLGEVSSDRGYVIPWMASDLTSATEISCAGCETVLITRGTISQWKDLPSEGWAEMMDFWHCHKPDVPHSHGGNGDVGRGISANSRLAIEQGVGLVGPMDLLFARGDCSSLQTQQTDTPSGTSNSLLCPKCNAYVGLYDHATQGYRLRKPHLAVSPSPSVPPASYESERWLACHLLNAAESQGVRKLSVWAADGDEPGKPVLTMQVWLFATDLTISSSVTKTPEPVSVVKVLYREIRGSPENADKGGMPAAGKLSAAALAESEVELEMKEWTALRGTLDVSGVLLPPKARKFQDWEVGLLRRFTVSDLHQGA
ncbi:hypothetical protein LTR36_002680 [Oleoguttula mirabilis]|uniref:Ubiquitin-conjugating enzyme E2-binding protein n=1 Tax=Oleoguttula mirabilis TaxID=1507867 RepID=A0AAV9JMK6_9PEZI|nr:hypothetical protein LTR36_002680 [Oleoguttula mirabilis]